MTVSPVLVCRPPEGQRAGGPAAPLRTGRGHPGPLGVLPRAAPQHVARRLPAPQPGLDTRPGASSTEATPWERASGGGRHRCGGWVPPAAGCGRSRLVPGRRRPRPPWTSSVRAAVAHVRFSEQRQEGRRCRSSIGHCDHSDSGWNSSDAAGDQRVLIIHVSFSFVEHV